MNTETGIILYGAGKNGQAYYQFLKESGYADIVYGFCDKRGNILAEIDGKKVWRPEELENKTIKYCITIKDQGVSEEIRNKTGKENCIEFGDIPDLLHVDKIKFNRDFCAFFHLCNMDTYFENAEEEKSLEIFWNYESEFYKMFQKIDTSNIIELACGRGRHVPHYCDKAKKITLVDILKRNIEICKKRFSDSQKIEYYQNDGFDLKELKSSEYSALFSYDAMVHFELMDIYSYLKDIYRVLVGGGQSVASSFKLSERLQGGIL